MICLDASMEQFMQRDQLSNLYYTILENTLKEQFMQIDQLHATGALYNIKYYSCLNPQNVLADQIYLVTKDEVEPELPPKGIMLRGKNEALKQKVQEQEETIRVLMEKTR